VGCSCLSLVSVLLAPGATTWLLPPSPPANSTAERHRERRAPSRPCGRGGLPTLAAQWPAESQRRSPAPRLGRPHAPAPVPRTGRRRSADRRCPRNVCPGHPWGMDRACAPQRRWIAQPAHGARPTRTLGTSWARRSGTGSPTWASRGCSAAADLRTARPPTRALPAPPRPPASVRRRQYRPRQRPGFSHARSGAGGRRRAERYLRQEA